MGFVYLILPYIDKNFSTLGKIVSYLATIAT
jgi:hypothetical protein